MKENVLQGGSVEFLFYGIKLVFHIVSEPVYIADSVFVRIFRGLVHDIVCQIVGLPQTVSFYNPQIDGMTYKLVAVVLVTQGRDCDFLGSKRLADVQMDIAFLLFDSREDAVKILSRRLYVLL